MTAPSLPSQQRMGSSEEKQSWDSPNRKRGYEHRRRGYTEKVGVSVRTTEHVSEHMAGFIGWFSGLGLRWSTNRSSLEPTTSVLCKIPGYATDGMVRGVWASWEAFACHDSVEGSITRRVSGCKSPGKAKHDDDDGKIPASALYCDSFGHEFWRVTEQSAPQFNGGAYRVYSRRSDRAGNIRSRLT